MKDYKINVIFNEKARGIDEIFSNVLLRELRRFLEGGLSDVSLVKDEGDNS